MIDELRGDLELSECAEPSSSTRTAPSFQAISSASRVYVTRDNWTTRADTYPKVDARTFGVYLRADPEDLSILDGRDDQKRVELMAERLRHWKSIKTA